MRINTLLLTVILIASAFFTYGGTIKGKVSDAQGGLPFATVYVEGTTQGTNANADGFFELALSPGTYRILCRYVGYKQEVFSVVIKGEEVIEHSFKLQPQSTEMNEFVFHVSSEDPAYPIIRQAIKKRKFHLEQIKSFQTSIYFKGIAHSRVLPKKVMGQKIKPEDLGVDSSGKGIMYLTEEDADYFVQGDKERTIIHSVHTSGDPKGVGFSRFPPVITFYENNVSIFGKTSRGYISPISDNALNYYKYKLEGDFTEQGHKIYKIKVMQKRPYEPCFNGTLYIVDEDFAIHSMNMLLTKTGGLDFMDTVKVDQVYIPADKDKWIIKSQVIYFTIGIFGFDMTGSGVSVYNNQRVNAPISDTMFSGNVVSSYDKIANKKDLSYWTQNRPIPLKADEVKDYVIKDSIRKVDEDPVRIDSLRRKGNKFKPLAFLLTGYTCNFKEYKNTVSTNSLLLGLSTPNIVNYNIAEGLNIAPKFHFRHTIDTGKYLYTDLALRYGFSNTHFNAIARAYYVKDDREWIGRRWIVGGEAGKYVFQYDRDNPVSEWFNTYSALLYRENDLKIYERWDATAFVKRNYGNGLSWTLKASYQVRDPLMNTTNYSIFPGNKDGFSSNLPPALVAAASGWNKHDAALLNGSVAYQPGFTYTQYPDYKIGSRSGWPIFTLTYDKGISGILNSIVNYDKWRFTIRDDIRLRLAGSLSYNIGIGGFLNTDYVSIPDLMHLYGNRGIGYASPYLQSFQFAQYYDFSNKKSLYEEVHLEYHLNGLLSNKIPFLKQAQWYLLFGGNAFYATDKTYYTEAFVGIDNIGYKLLRFLRIDFVQSWDSYMGHNSGIRFGLNSRAFTVSSGNGPVKGEW